MSLILDDPTAITDQDLDAGIAKRAAAVDAAKAATRAAEDGLWTLTGERDRRRTAIRSAAVAGLLPAARDLLAEALPHVVWNVAMADAPEPRRLIREPDPFWSGLVDPCLVSRWRAGGHDAMGGHVCRGTDTTTAAGIAAGVLAHLRRMLMRPIDGMDPIRAEPGLLIDVRVTPGATRDQVVVDMRRPATVVDAAYVEQIDAWRAGLLARLADVGDDAVMAARLAVLDTVRAPHGDVMGDDFGETTPEQRDILLQWYWCTPFPAGVDHDAIVAAKRAAAHAGASMDGFRDHMRRFITMAMDFTPGSTTSALLPAVDSEPARDLRFRRRHVPKTWLEQMVAGPIRCADPTRPDAWGLAMRRHVEHVREYCRGVPVSMDPRSPDYLGYGWQAFDATASDWLRSS